MLPFKHGAFAAAVANQVPVLPVVISHYDFLDLSEDKRLEAGLVDIDVLDPISTVGLTMDEVEGLAEETRKMMLRTFMEQGQA